MNSFIRGGVDAYHEALNDRSEAHDLDLLRRAVAIVTKQRDDMEISPLTGAAYPRNRLFLDVLADTRDEDDRERDDDDDDESDEIEKAHAHPRGHHQLVGALVEHLHDALERRREHHGYQKSAKEEPMDSLENILKDYGPIKLCKHIVETQHAPCDEHSLVAALTKSASEMYSGLTPAQAFAKLYAEPDVWRACAVAKAMPFHADLTPLMVGGEANRGGDVNPDNPSEAIAQLKQLGARKWPTASEADQFERALCDPANHKLARRAVPIPQPTTSFPFPR